MISIVSEFQTHTCTHTTYNSIGAAAQKESYDEQDGKEEEDKRKKEIE